MKKVIIIGATTGIGRSLAELYAQKGYEIAITGRRENLLDEIKEQFPNTKIHVRKMDVADIETSRKTMDELAQTMSGIDIVVVNAGVGYIKADFLQEIATIDINVRGFVGLTHWAYNYFKEKGGGQVVGVSSIAGIRSSPYAPEYHASKAFMSSYMEGLRLRSRKWNSKITVTDIRPGFVDTPMTKQNKGMFWVASSEKAAQQIYDAIEAKKSVAYITKRYVLIAWLLRLMPEWMIAKAM
jgi:short-subunit dehydrogenase